jgi:hypothetical protein
MMPITIAAATLSYLVMLAAYFLHRQRWLHVTAMLSIIVFDVAMPFYLYLHRNWWKRLVEEGDIASFLVWMHLGLLIAMYVLDGAQIITARKIFKGEHAARGDHYTQGRALLVVRGLVILTGAILANPE